MLLAYLDLLEISVKAFVVFFGSVLVALLLGISFHEFCHALAADSLGDPTARRLGRLSLNPKAHLDPVGTLLLFLGGFGWGKPVPVNPYGLRNGAKAGMAMVAAAGPLSNLAIAAAFALPIKADIVPWHTPFLVPSSMRFWGTEDYLGLFMSSVVIFNVVLAVFNFIPLAPLDGFRVAVGILPAEMSDTLLKLEQYGPPILFALIALPFLTGGSFSLLFDFMSPIINGIIHTLAGIGGNAIG